MAHAYTPGLKVSPVTVVRKRRLLPLDGQVAVKVGEKVTADKVVARTELPGAVRPVNVVNQLSIEPGDLPQFMLKGVGEAVAEGEPIAENKPWLKFLKTVVASPMNGTIASISTITGQVMIQAPPRPIELSAYVSGRIVEVVPGRGVTVETSAALVQGIFGVGGETHGKLRMAVAAPDAVLTPQDITADDKGKVLVGGALLTRECFDRAKAMNVAGLIVGGLHDQDLRDILGREIGVAVTGGENIGLTIILTEGFGQIRMADRVFDLLRGLNGHYASICGATQIRAGVMRPEVIVPRVELPSVPTVRFGGGGAQGMKPGDPVRVIRDPGFGTIGQIVELPSTPQPLESETVVRVARVRFSDNTTRTVPRSNLEAIER